MGKNTKQNGIVSSLWRNLTTWYRRLDEVVSIKFLFAVSVAIYAYLLHSTGSNEAKSHYRLDDWSFIQGVGKVREHPSLVDADI
jgi:hypothetical protein